MISNLQKTIEGLNETIKNLKGDDKVKRCPNGGFPKDVSGEVCHSTNVHENDESSKCQINYDVAKNVTENLSTTKSTKLKSSVHEKTNPSKCLNGIDNHTSTVHENKKSPIDKEEITELNRVRTQTQTQNKAEMNSCSNLNQIKVKKWNF